MLRYTFVLSLQLLFLFIIIQGRQLTTSSSTTRKDTAKIYNVGSFTDFVERISTKDGYDETDFYYPLVTDTVLDEDVAREDNDIDNDNDSDLIFPLIVFLSGGLVDKSLHSIYATQLASYGYIVLIPNHLQKGVIGTEPALFSSQYTPEDVWIDVLKRNQNESSPLFGIVNTELAGISGHSNGGGAALFATTNVCQFPFCNPQQQGNNFTRPKAFQAAVVVSTHLVPMGGPPNAESLEPINIDNEIPVALINGDLDDMDHVCASWKLIEEIKDLIILEGANHWACVNIQNPPTNTPDPANQTVSQEWSINMCSYWTAVFYDAYLKDDGDALKQLDNPFPIEGVMINQHCQDSLMDIDDNGTNTSNTSIASSAGTVRPPISSLYGAMLGVLWTTWI